MLKSMTGYGRGESRNEKMEISAEIKSVNHRYADINIKLPRFLGAYENDVRKHVAKKIGRGKVDVYLNHSALGEVACEPVLNEPLAQAYADVFRDLKAKCQLNGDVSLELLAAQRDVVTLQEVARDEEGLKQQLYEAINSALAAHDQMRCAEGEATAVDMRERLATIESMLVAIIGRAPAVAQEWQEKLLERLAKLQPDVAADPQRVAQEVALFADRCDISEEVTRFRSHLVQFLELFNAAEPVGRQMDFLLQELNRETNTMGSKSNDAELTRKVVAIKAELEKIREQVQNVE